MRAIVMTVSVLFAFTAASFAATAGNSVDALAEKLRQKGVISDDDLRDLGRQRGKRELTAPPEANADASAQREEKPKLPVEIKIRVQARLDAGDLLVGSDQRYRSESDLFLRRARLEFDKELKSPPIGKELDLNLTLDADRTDQEFRRGQRRNPSNDISLHYLYGDWIFFDPLAFEIGRHKLPFLRAELTSSSRQLLIERPSSDGAANSTFGDYNQSQIMAHGEILEKAFRYYLSYCDGAANLSALQGLDPAASAVRKEGWGKAFIGRVEIAPLGLAGRGFVEAKKDDTGIGGEDHLTLAIEGGLQQGIKYSTSAVADARVDTRLIGFDLAGRYTFGAAGTLTAQAEYLTFRREFNYRAAQRPQAGYLQAGFLFPIPVLGGKVEPALRYEVFDHDRIENGGFSGSKERNFTIGLNHYLLKHNIKWAYNFVHTRFDQGVAEAVNDTTRNLHQLLLQLYF